MTIQVPPIDGNDENDLLSNANKLEGLRQEYQKTILNRFILPAVTDENGNLDHALIQDLHEIYSNHGVDLSERQIERGFKAATPTVFRSQMEPSELRRVLMARRLQLHIDKDFLEFCARWKLPVGTLCKNQGFDEIMALAKSMTDEFYSTVQRRKSIVEHRRQEVESKIIEPMVANLIYEEGAQVSDVKSIVRNWLRRFFVVEYKAFT